MLLLPVFLTIEYNTPNFPPDSYGFSLEDRLYWSKIASDYLINHEGISFLGDLRFADGSPVYNQRELKHMVDVKVVLQKALLVWYLSLGAMLLLGLWAWRGGWLILFRQRIIPRWFYHINLDIDNHSGCVGRFPSFFRGLSSGHSSKPGLRS